MSCNSSLSQRDDFCWIRAYRAAANEPSTVEEQQPVMSERFEPREQPTIREGADTEESDWDNDTLVSHQSDG